MIKEVKDSEGKFTVFSIEVMVSLEVLNVLVLKALDKTDSHKQLDHLCKVVEHSLLLVEA